MSERTTGIPEDSPDNTVRNILKIMQEEAFDLGADLKVEEHEDKTISSSFCASIKRDGRTFRIRLSWVRDELLENGSLTVGHGYIETEWSLKLKTDVVSHPPQPPFLWHIEPTRKFQESAEARQFPQNRILDGPLLRQLIREKLSVQPQT